MMDIFEHLKSCHIKMGQSYFLQLQTIGPKPDYKEISTKLQEELSYNAESFTLK